MRLDRSSKSHQSRTLLLAACALVVAALSLGCQARSTGAGESPGVPAATATAAGPSAAPPSTAPIPEPTTDADPTPEASDTAVAIDLLLGDPNNHLDLETLPRDGAATDEATAVQAALDFVNVPGPALYTDYGVAYVTDDVSATVWLVIAKVPEQNPYPVGPNCGEVEGCHQQWAVGDYSVALVSDETGRVLKSFTSMKPAEAPSPIR